MTVKEFLELDFNDLNKIARVENRKEAEKMLKDMSNIANRRLERLSKLDIPSPAFQNRAITDEEGFVKRNNTGDFMYERFQSTGEDLRDIRRELKYIHSFLSSQTSTVKGARRFLEDMVMRAGGYTTRAEAKRNMWTYEESKVFWSAYDKLKETDFNKVMNIIGSDETQKVVREVFQSTGAHTSDELWELAKDALTRLRDERLQAAYYGTSE